MTVSFSQAVPNQIWLSSPLLHLLCSKGSVFAFCLRLEVGTRERQRTEEAELRLVYWQLLKIMPELFRRTRCAVIDMARAGEIPLLCKGESRCSMPGRMSRAEAGRVLQLQLRCLGPALVTVFELQLSKPRNKTPALGTLTSCFLPLPSPFFP